MSESIYTQLTTHTPTKGQISTNFKKDRGETMNSSLKTMYSWSLEKEANKLLGSVKNRMEHNLEIIIMPLAQSETHQQL